MNKMVRVRFAPSPTGALHIGGVRTALYNYLFAKKHQGSMVLRIEDTDQARYVKEAEEYLYDALNWSGIIPDESPKAGGEFAPYRQSERKHIYKEYADQLVANGSAYYAFDTAEELEAMRERLKAAKANSLTYNAITRQQMKNSLTLPPSEVQDRINSGQPYVIRFKVPMKEDVRLNDLIRGWVVVHSTAVDDKVIMKSDGMPTYHLANVVDDHLMQITHVIRGEEWLPSAPLHVLLYRALGWEAEMPQFAHLPLLLKPDGNGKLSKRDGDKHGFPVFPVDGIFLDKHGKEEKFNGFREAGYFPEAFINFLALLGWNPGTDQELFSMEELIENFSIDRVNKSGAQFDIEKAKWFNQQCLRMRTPQELGAELMPKVKTAGYEISMGMLSKICKLMQERIDFSHQVLTEGKYLFEAPSEYDDKVVKKRWNPILVEVLKEYSNQLKSHDQLTADTAKEILTAILDAKGLGLGQVMQGLRVAITGKGGGPDLMEIIEILGVNEVTLRISAAVETLTIRHP